MFVYSLRDCYDYISNLYYFAIFFEYVSSIISLATQKENDIDFLFV